MNRPILFAVLMAGLRPGQIRDDGFFDPQLDEKCDNEEVYE